MLYLACGIALLVSIAGLLYYALAGAETKAALRARNYVFWFETLGVVAFAISWLAKGKIVQGVANLVGPGGDAPADKGFDEDDAPTHS